MAVFIIMSMKKSALFRKHTEIVYLEYRRRPPPIATNHKSPYKCDRSVSLLHLARGGGVGAYIGVGALGKGNALEGAIPSFLYLLGVEDTAASAAEDVQVIIADVR